METVDIVELAVAKTYAMVVVVAVHNQGVVEVHPEREHEVVTREAPDGHGVELLGVGIYGIVDVVLAVGSSRFRRLPDRGKDTFRRADGQTVENEEEDNNSAEDADIDCSVTEDIEGGDVGGVQRVNEQVDIPDMGMVDTESGGLRRKDQNGSSLATENSTGCFPARPRLRSILLGRICSSNGKE